MIFNMMLFGILVLYSLWAKRQQKMLDLYREKVLRAAFKEWRDTFYEDWDSNFDLKLTPDGLKRLEKIKEQTKAVGIKEVVDEAVSKYEDYLAQREEKNERK